jgi:XTP/dITP diphosphohydrolase
MKLNLMVKAMQSLANFETLIIATHNTGKLREFQALLKPYVKHITSAGELELVEPEETGTTFAENALLKARAASHTGHMALADDSGLCVNALGGDPGLYSARWAGPDKNFRAAMQKIHDALGHTKDHSAYFICVLALVWPDDRSERFEGRVDGTIVWPPRGDKGHGYDPVFVPKGDTRTFAEMPEEEKNTISHRGIAVRKLIAFFEQSGIKSA